MNQETSFLNMFSDYEPPESYRDAISQAAIAAVDIDENVITGNVVAIDTKNCIVESSNKLIATVGLRDTVVIDTDDAILISSKECVSDIKEVLKNLRETDRSIFL